MLFRDVNSSAFCADNSPAITVRAAMSAARKEPKFREQSARLTRLFLEGRAAGLFTSEDDMGAKVALGNQAFVNQLKLGHRPLNLETSAKWARACKRRLSEVSPELTELLISLATEFLPNEGFEIRAKPVVGDSQLAPKTGTKSRVFRSPTRAITNPKSNNLSGVSVGGFGRRADATERREQQSGRRPGKNLGKLARAVLFSSKPTPHRPHLRRSRSLSLCGRSGPRCA